MYKIVFIAGSAGVGKGTNCTRIVQDFGFTHISTDDLYRDALARQDPYALKTEKLVKNGGLVDSDFIMTLLENAMKKAVAEGKRPNFLVDGFPRNESNMEAWNKHMNGKVQIELVIVLDCPVNIVIDRLNGRGRSDDNTDAIKRRVTTYEKETVPLIEKHFGSVCLIEHIDASRTPDEVYKDVKKTISFLDIFT